MTRRIEHRSTSHRPARHIHAALVDTDYLRARLTELGGDVAELVSHSATEDGVHFRTRQRIPDRDLPAVLRPVLPGSTLLERSETWRERDPEHFTGEVAAMLRGVPGSVTASLWLRDLEEEHNGDAEPTAGEPEVEKLPDVSEFLLQGEIRVKLPLLADKPEELLERWVRTLIEQECEFTHRWLSGVR
ncbi:hypothetical protein FHR84_002048 [Actinopolyspora biskrensis]|uniref:DUF2505 domain-containing protein n=1 Tax=Actinopolyspora biskrensis TaxID=1470178 RepID=A0A852Z9F6_9ACTN|nr:DUF2505 domain-containing protein [Actinopolyspora biskrensis]NYH78723.1 hypothetical protein [Actinopolyspora biskrensis]